MRKKLFLILITTMFLSSCGKNNYYSFTNTELELIPYEEGDIFGYIINPASDTIHCKVISKELFHEKTHYALHISTSSVQICKVKIEATNEIEIEIRYVKSLEGLSFEIYIDNIKANSNKAFFYESATIDSIKFINNFDLNGKVYKDAFAFIDDPDDHLYYSKDFGIIKFTLIKKNEEYIYCEF